MSRLQDAVPGDPQRAWQRRPNSVFINPLHLAPESTKFMITSRLPVYWHDGAARYLAGRRSKIKNRSGDLLDLGPRRKICLRHVLAVHRRIHDRGSDRIDEHALFHDLLGEATVSVA